MVVVVGGEGHSGFVLKWKMREKDWIYKSKHKIIANPLQISHN